MLFNIPLTVRMTKILVIFDPIPDGFSVQFDLIKSILVPLSRDYNVTAATVFLPIEKQSDLEKLGIKVLKSAKKGFSLYNILYRIGMTNETFLWTESWFREVFFKRNQFSMGKIVNFNQYDHVINISYTIPFRNNILWIQGPPVIVTLDSIKNHNFLAKLATTVFGDIINTMDMRHLRNMRRLSNNFVVSSGYLQKLYENLGFDTTNVIHSVKNLDAFKPSTLVPRRDYILLYIGKETDFEPVKEMINQNLPIVAFGSKIPIGNLIDYRNDKFFYRGFVSEHELIELYSNALFTAFPFTTEGFGWVPLESMSCGTPVLTYDKDGPSETVLNGVTGALVSSPREFLLKALQWWTDKDTKIKPEMCVSRAKEFEITSSVNKLRSLLEGI